MRYWLLSNISTRRAPSTLRTRTQPIITRNTLQHCFTFELLHKHWTDLNFDLYWVPIVLGGARNCPIHPRVELETIEYSQDGNYLTRTAR